MKAKKKTEGKAPPRPRISRTVLKMIKEERLDAKEGKEEAARVVKAVRALFPNSKFGLTHYFWYLSRYRSQKALGLPVDRLVPIEGGRRAKAKKGKAHHAKAPAKVKAKAKAHKHAPAKAEARKTVEA